ncbi:MAG TPA: glycine/sarcosine/betaine reductase component B subunit [Terriglobales bacterium]|nr:glycine/sarcosine/betaine reductase component B subunit [Terriglobales bacterium]
MNLVLAHHPITEIGFGASATLDGETLIIDREALERCVLEDESVASVDFEIVRPGESCRAGPVFDIVEPRAKAPGGSPDFPGILGAPQTAGLGTTHVLPGIAVTLLAEEPAGDSRGVGYLLEMSGAAAEGSGYASLHHIVILLHTKADLPGYAKHRAYRMAGLKVAVQLAQPSIGRSPACTEVHRPISVAEEKRNGLPRVAYIGQIFSRQRKPEPEEKIIYGTNTEGMLPVVLHPDEWLDGAVLTSYHTSLGGAETYFYQNHPVITELYRRHDAGEIDFVGTIATIASANNFDRERNCRFAANLARWALKADAAVLTKFGGGVPHTDLAETARLLEGMGVKTAVQVTDLARDRRVESALLFNFPEVDAIVCIGGNGTSWKVPRVEHVVAASAELKESLVGPLEISALNVVGVANQQGASRLRAMVY